MGARDQDARRVAPDAAVAHRQDRRHPAFRERSVADRRRDRHHRPLGRRRRAAGRSEGHAARREPGRTRTRGGSPRSWASPISIMQVAGLHDAGASAGCVVEAGRRHRAHRAALGARHRDPSDHAQGPAHHPPRGRAAEAGRRQRHLAPGKLRDIAPGRRHRRRRPRTLHGVGGRQAGRDDAPQHRQADAARLEDRLGHSLSRRRRSDHRRGRARRSTSIRRGRSRSTGRCSVSSTPLPADRSRTSIFRPTR